jgi:indole-3-glycerol phosphate synthase
MNILDTIIATKRKEVAEKKSLVPVKLLEQSIYFQSPTVSLSHYLLREDKSGIIAEIKRKSPSAGVINAHLSVERTSIGYMQAGASALSILTDTPYFGGKNEDLTLARKFNFCPILRKEFVVEEYQVLEAKSIGADAVLLIAAVLTPNEVRKLAAFAHSLGLEVLLEVHNKEELLANLDSGVRLLGVNNRNLKTMQVEVATSLELAPFIPDDMLKVSESGISQPETVVQLEEAGYRGFLMGERFMHHGRPEEACREFITRLTDLRQMRLQKR